MRYAEPAANGCPAEVVTRAACTHVVVAMIPNKAFSTGHSVYTTLEEVDNEPKRGVLSLVRVRGSQQRGAGSLLAPPHQ